jgi:hypothetical protein
MNRLEDKRVIGRTIPVRDRGGPWGCETLRLTYFIENQLREAVRLSALCADQPPCTPRKIPVTYFC